MNSFVPNKPPGSESMGVLTFYWRPFNDFFAIAAQAPASKRKLTIDRYTGAKTLSASHGNTKVTIKGSEDVVISIAAIKLLIAIISTFKNQISRRTVLQASELTVLIPFKEYASNLGYCVEVPPQATVAEKKKARNAMDNAQHEIQQALELLRHVELAWPSESKKTARSDYEITPIVCRTGIVAHRSFIKASLENEIGEYLQKHYALFWIPINLWSLDGRQAHALYLCLAMSEHYGRNHLHNSKVANRLRVHTLLEKIGLPSTEDESVKRSSWRSRIKTPFEKSLNVLVEKGCLRNWTYLSGDSVLSAADVKKLNCEEWKLLVVCFELVLEKENSLQASKKEEPAKIKAR
ncbi:MAG: hypothetical protein LUC43_07775 [Burkholderiales bacterium]|nr:hypothetical protein [Burkholderiales bacterium]